MARQYSLEEKYRVAAALVSTGSPKAAGKEVGLPRTTIQSWLSQEEFQKLLKEVRHEFGQRIRGNLARVIRQATDQLLERIEHGDHVFDKNGTLVRKPMSGRDLAVAAGVAFDKLRLVEDRAPEEAPRPVNPMLEKIKSDVRRWKEHEEAQRRARIGLSAPEEGSGRD